MMMLRRSAGNVSRIARRQIHTGDLYVHRTIASEVGTDPLITVGLLSALERLRPGVGYFRPVDSTGDLKLIKRVFDLQDDISSMRAARYAEARQLLVDDKLDDLLEKVFVAFQSYKRRYDFVVIEGMHMRDSSRLNAQIASALGAPALLVTDAKIIREEARKLNLADESHEGDMLDWTSDAANFTRVRSLDFLSNSVSVAGTLVHNTPSTPGLHETFSKLFKEWDLPFVGYIPENPVSQSLKGDDKDAINRIKAYFDQHIDAEAVKRLLSSKGKRKAISPIQFKQSIFLKAKENKQVILLPEGEEPRTVQAADFILKHDICNLILMGARDNIRGVEKQFQADLSKAVIIDPADFPEKPEFEKYVNTIYNARKHKGVTLEQARDLLKKDPVTLATCIVAENDADGLVCGAVTTTANTVRPALQIIKTNPGLETVSSVFLICLQDKVLVYGDVAIKESPTSKQLADIAISSAETAAAFGLLPRIAMLSYATGDSNSGPMVQKVADAVAIVQKERPDLLVDGPLQYDAAVNPIVASVKIKGKASPVAGHANVFIFPDLNASNIACKAVQQHTGAVAIGPILQGLRKPVNDLSRGCTVKDIEATIATTALQAAARKEREAIKRAADEHYELCHE